MMHYILHRIYPKYSDRKARLNRVNPDQTLCLIRVYTAYSDLYVQIHNLRCGKYQGPVVQNLTLLANMALKFLS